MMEQMKPVVIKKTDFESGETSKIFASIAKFALPKYIGNAKT